MYFARIILPSRLPPARQRQETFEDGQVADRARSLREALPIPPPPDRYTFLVIAHNDALLPSPRRLSHRHYLSHPVCFSSATHNFTRLPTLVCYLSFARLPHK